MAMQADLQAVADAIAAQTTTITTLTQSIIAALQTAIAAAGSGQASPVTQVALDSIVAELQGSLSQEQADVTALQAALPVPTGVAAAKTLVLTPASQTVSVAAGASGGAITAVVTDGATPPVVLAVPVSYSVDVPANLQVSTGGAVQALVAGQTDTVTGTVLGSKPLVTATCIVITAA